ncbi:MAG: DNA primase [Bdellovibrionales bacterium CG10_big_fil_rev_8_21_14_0_10_45_34]|nr:MAG: DNA primase [Bdellovibrionales bacterium CG10_big_fil_rev_8_21_14_0_10_45_34]
MRFSDDFIERARSSADLVDIISKTTQLKKSGAEWTGLCPFPDHKEKTPSFRVNEVKQAFYCFGCGKSGNVFSFYQKYYGLGFVETVELLAKKAGIELPKATSRSIENRSENQDSINSLKEINRVAATWFHNNLMALPKTSFIWKYLQGRGISEETITAFQLGYAPEGWDGLTNELTKRRLSLNFASQLGLVRARKSGSGYFDMFRHRLMFPITSPTQDVVGFGGRTLGDDKPKYINSPESPLFHKGQILYGLHEAAKHIRVSGSAIVVEGYMDTIALAKEGIGNVVAVLGTALSGHHVKTLKRQASQIIVLFDGDQAGQRASDHALQIFLQEGVPAKSLTLPDKLDPDDYVKAFGADTLRQQITGASDLFIEFLSRQMTGFHPVPADQIRVMKTLKPLLASISDGALLSLYIDEVTGRLNVTRSWVEGFLKSPANDSHSTVNKYAKEPRDHRVSETLSQSLTEKPVGWVESGMSDTSQVLKADISKSKKLELMALALCVSSQDLLEQFLQSDGVNEIVDPAISFLFEKLITRYRHAPTQFDSLEAYLTTYVVEAEPLFRMLRMNRYESVEAGNQLMADCISRLKERRLKVQSDRMTRELRSSSDPLQLEQFMNIQRAKQRLKDS